VYAHTCSTCTLFSAIWEKKSNQFCLKNCTSAGVSPLMLSCSPNKNKRRIIRNKLYSFLLQVAHLSSASLGMEKEETSSTVPYRQGRHHHLPNAKVMRTTEPVGHGQSGTEGKLEMEQGIQEHSSWTGIFEPLNMDWMNLVYIYRDWTKCLFYPNSTTRLHIRAACLTGILLPRFIHSFIMWWMATESCSDDGDTGASVGRRCDGV